MTDEKYFADWAVGHAVRFDSLDPQAPLDDLEPLGELIGDARVVAIGESAHYVREFYLLRHRVLRFLTERCGTTVYALEAPFTQAHVIDGWAQGGPGDVEDVAAAGVAIDLGRCREFHDQLRWMRAHNRAGATRLRLAGTDLPGSGGSPLPALEEVAAYVRSADPDALPLVEQAISLTRDYHDPATFNVLARYAALDHDTQDALTAALSRLLSRMESMAGWQASRQHGREHAAALRHLRGAWHVDHLHRDVAGRGLPVAPASRDAFMAESVLELLEDLPADARILVASHNIHLQKTPISSGDAFGMFPQGYHLAQALGDDYVAIAATGMAGRTAQIQPDPDHPQGFEAQDLPLPSPADGSVEAALATLPQAALLDLRAARCEVRDADAFQRLRMEGYFVDVPVFDAFDAIVAIPETTCTDYVTARTDKGQHVVSASSRPSSAAPRQRSAGEMSR
jgi:erythromycin esterase